MQNLLQSFVHGFDDHWADGPEGGMVFWRGDASGSLVAPFTYENWGRLPPEGMGDNNEPNDFMGFFAGGEDYAHLQGFYGWNDLPNIEHTPRRGYFVECSGTFQVTKSLTDGPLGPDGMGGLEPISGVDQGPYIAIGVRDQYWAFEVLITGGSDSDGQVYVDGIPSLYELSPFFEEFETGIGCPDDGACDGIGEQDCPVTVTPPPSRGQSGQTLIAIDPTDLEIGESCTTTVYVKLREGAISNIRSCPTAAFDDSSLNYTFPFNDGVQCFDAYTNELVAGPFDPIRLMPVGCP